MGNISQPFLGFYQGSWGLLGTVKALVESDWSSSHWSTQWTGRSTVQPHLGFSAFVSLKILCLTCNQDLAQANLARICYAVAYGSVSLRGCCLSSLLSGTGAQIPPLWEAWSLCSHLPSQGKYHSWIRMSFSLCVSSHKACPCSPTLSSLKLLKTKSEGEGLG